MCGVGWGGVGWGGVGWGGVGWGGVGWCVCVCGGWGWGGGGFGMRRKGEEEREDEKKIKEQKKREKKRKERGKCDQLLFFLSSSPSRASAFFTFFSPFSTRESAKGVSEFVLMSLFSLERQPERARASICFPFFSPCPLEQAQESGSEFFSSFSPSPSVLLPLDRKGKRVFSFMFIRSLTHPSEKNDKVE